ALRTLPSSTWLTPSLLATSQTSTDWPLNVKAVLRAITARAEPFDKSVVMSSLIPSLKYSCSASPLMLANGRTHTHTCRPCARGAAFAVSTTTGASACKLATSLRQPAALVSPLHPLRSAHWIWLNGIGGMVLSTATWTKVPDERAASA